MERVKMLDEKTALKGRRKSLDWYRATRASSPSSFFGRERCCCRRLERNLVTYHLITITDGKWPGDDDTLFFYIFSLRPGHADRHCWYGLVPLLYCWCGPRGDHRRRRLRILYDIKYSSGGRGRKAGEQTIPWYASVARSRVSTVSDTLFNNGDDRKIYDFTHVDRYW